MDAHNLIEPDEPKETTRAKNKALKDPSIVHCMGKEKWWNFDGLLFGSYWDKFAGKHIPKNRKTCLEINGFTIIRN